MFNGLKPVSELRSVTCHTGSHDVDLPPDTGERAPSQPQTDTSWYSIYLGLPRKDGRLSWL